LHFHGPLDENDSVSDLENEPPIFTIAKKKVGNPEDYTTKVSTFSNTL
jgi:hypothetical protein